MKLVRAYDKLINLGGFPLGEEPLIIAGPCSLENYERMAETAAFLERENVRFLRAAAYKPRTSPYSFQGLGAAGLEIIKKIKAEFNLQIVSELVDLSVLDLFRERVDIIQIGARNMQNFATLKAAGATGKPVLLKRGFGNTVEEWLYAAEYLLGAGAETVILCERGIRTFEPLTRDTLDLGAIAYAKKITRLPVIADPSHAAGRSDLVLPLALGAVAAGADGLMLEVHPSPSESVSDDEQAIGFSEFRALVKKAREVWRAAR